MQVDKQRFNLKSDGHADVERESCGCSDSLSIRKRCKFALFPADTKLRRGLPTVCARSGCGREGRTEMQGMESTKEGKWNPHTCS